MKSSAHLPTRVSLLADTERILLQGIAEQRWKGLLPAERLLSQDLQISRSTLRAALLLLAARKLIVPEHGRGWRIKASSSKREPRAQLRRIGWLSQEPIEHLDTFGIIWVNQLRERLQRNGLELDLYHRPRCFGKNCSTQLAELTRLHPNTCWVISYSTPSMQRWFQAKGLPTIIAGSLHDGVNLPSIDIDLRSMGRHAAGMMFARGHRRIAVLAPIHGRSGVPAGFLEIERGVRESFAASRSPDNQLTVTYHGGSPEDVCRAVDRLLRMAQPATALLLIDSDTLLTTLTYLGQLQKVVPRDLSIATCYGEPYFSRVVPELTYYAWQPEKFAQQIFRLVRASLQQVLAPDTRVRIMPRFVTGQTLAVLPPKPVSKSSRTHIFL